jgi:hypothetical protein
MGSFDPMEVGGARTSPHAPVHRLDEPSGLSLGMVASLALDCQTKTPCRWMENLWTRPFEITRRSGGTGKVREIVNFVSSNK